MAKGQETTYEQVLCDIAERDRNDSTRKASPMKKADDAELLDTTGMTIDEVVMHICGRVRQDMGR